MRENQNPKRLNDLGEAYFSGINQEKNIEIAFSYFKQAADQENPVGMYNLARYYIEKKDYKQAQENLVKSKSFGYVPAAILLSEMILKGQGSRKSKKRAFKIIDESSATGDTEALNQLAHFYLKGIGTKKDADKAFEVYQKSADLNNKEGMLQLSLLYLERKGQKNFDSALHYLDKAATLLYPKAIIKIRDLYLSNHKYFQKKSMTHVKEMIFYYTELLAKTNDIDALREVALTYYNGSSLIGMNDEKAFQYFFTLSELKDKIGFYGLGLCYLNARHTDQDMEKAKSMFELAKKLNYPNAYTKLGDIYRTLAKEPVDYEKAKSLYMDAAKMNDSEAFLNLGLLHYRKQIVSATNALAFQNVEHASKLGDNAAFYWLGVFYDKGIGVQKNPVLAEKSLLKSIQLGHTGALFKYAQFQYEQLKDLPKHSKKQKTLYMNAIKMFMSYVNESSALKQNRILAYTYLYEAFKSGVIIGVNLKASRLYLEKAAELGNINSWTKLYILLRDTEFEYALSLLRKSLESHQDGEACYEYGLLYLDGLYGYRQDVRQARMFLEDAAKLGYQKALERLMMMK